MNSTNTTPLLLIEQPKPVKDSERGSYKIEHESREAYLDANRSYFIVAVIIIISFCCFVKILREIKKVNRLKF